MKQDKVVVVAGAGPGNGAALARRFSAEDKPMAMLARSKERTHALVAAILGTRGYACDVGDGAASCLSAPPRPGAAPRPPPRSLRPRRRNATWQSRWRARSGRRASTWRLTSSTAWSTSRPHAPRCPTNRTTSSSTLLASPRLPGTSPTNPDVRGASRWKRDCSARFGDAYRTPLTCSQKDYRP